MRIRVRFAKYGSLRFIGHLDIMRYFQKANRRAFIPVRYSEGFSPHQIMSFASPLGLGLTSEGEYMDLELTRPISSEEAVKALNDTMAEGACVKSFLKLPDGCPGAMASVAGADYQIVFKKGGFDRRCWEDILAAYGEAPSLMIVKKTKKSERLIDLKEDIHQLSILLPKELEKEKIERYFPEGEGGLSMRLSAKRPEY